MGKLPCCICGSDKVVALAKYVHPMCKECWECYIVEYKGGEE